MLATIPSTEVVALAGALVAIATPLNTALLLISRRRQKAANHYADVIRQLAAAIAKEKAPYSQAEPHEVAAAVEQAVRETAPEEAPR